MSPCRFSTQSLCNEPSSAQQARICHQSSQRASNLVHRLQRTQSPTHGWARLLKGIQTSRWLFEVLTFRVHRCNSVCSCLERGFPRTVAVGSSFPLSFPCVSLDGFQRNNGSFSYRQCSHLTRGEPCRRRNVNELTPRGMMLERGAHSNWA